ncbi:MAG: glutamyl-tRNA amidotransferase [Oscillospiraceae bacterium]|nr:glutamyl-tRNA amidotransferase [Oscillospiraceae bacterium]
MVYVTECAYCVHSRKEKAKGWISTCDAFPEGKPLDFDYSNLRNRKECNNGIGFESGEEKTNNATLK